jgi:TnpA family transposase
MLMAITGDMRSINKANFAILHGFGRRFEPRFTDLQRELKELSCADTPAAYEKCLIQPTGQIDLQVIIYTLRYLRDPQLERTVHRSQNRIESYHQLRSAIAQVGGKKELTGRTDSELEISNQCGRLIADAIIYYNSAILSRLLTRWEANGNSKARAFVANLATTWGTHSGHIDDGWILVQSQGTNA